MPISQTTSQIPRTEWDKRKGRLIELYLDLKRPLCGPNGVIETMANEGFTATKPQYEYQFRLWKLRKNMKRHEYERIIQERQHGGEPSPITLEGRVISDARSKRALRRYEGGIGQAEGTVSRNDDEAAGENTASLTSTGGRYIPAENPVFEASTPANGLDNRAGDMATNLELSPINPEQDRSIIEEPVEMIGMPCLEDYGTFESYMDIDVSMNLVDFSLSGPLPDASLPNETPGPVTDVVRINPQVLSPQLAEGWFDTAIDLFQHSPNSMAVVFPGSPNGPHRQIRILQKNQWIPPSTAITSMLIKDICDTAPTSSTRDVMSISCDLISDFLVDIESAGKRRPFANSSLVPRSLLSTKTFFGENFTELPSDVTSCVVAEARLYSRLIRWVINGFANLEHLPAAGILRFLNKHSTTSSSMIPLLSSNPSPAAKSLAEKIFRAALEQDNVSIVSFLLNHSKSVHANDTICYDDGQRYTPLELASRYQSYRVIELLIQWNVDVNKSFSHNSHLNALDLLLKNFDLRFQIADRLPDLVDRFLSARAKVSLSCILNQVYKLPNPDLTIRLINEFGSPQELFLDNGFLEEIAREFEKPYAERTLELVIERCQEVGANWCSYHYLLNRALERQYDELAKLLLPYIPQSDVTRILRSFKPYRSHRSHRPYSFERINIETLIVALKSKDQDNLRAVLEKDMLKNLKDCELGRAFTTALEEGNIQFAIQILDFDPDLRFADGLDFDWSAAIRAALAHDYDDIAWELTAVIIATGGTPPLDIAVEQKKPEFVRGFIEHGWRNSYRITHTILEDAIRWGDNSIVRDLWQARYGEIYPHHSLMELAIEKGQIDLFWDIFEVWGIQNPNDRWPGGIVIAIERQDLRLLDEMISRGARLDDDKALETALNKHFSMARPLLERYRQAYPEGCTGYGRRSIEKAFFKVLERPDRIDLFFEFNLINGYTLQGYENGGTLLAGVLERIKRYQFGGKDCYDSSLIEKLLAAGSDVNAVSANNKTVFLLAIQTERAEIIELLIKRGAEVNKQARFGIMHTPLQKAAELNNMKIVGLLLKYGAEVNASPATFGGATALQFAAIHGNCDLAMTLVEHGARLDVPPSKGSHGRWPLEGAAENGRLDMIQLLWDTNNGPFDDKQCQKAMRLAEYYGHFGCKDLIMELMAKSSRGSW